MSNCVKNNLDMLSRRQWKAAIADVQRHLNIAKHRAKKLEQIIQQWTRLRDEGMLWPGAQSASDEQSHNG
jgi:hypothetical protein